MYLESPYQRLTGRLTFAILLLLLTLTGCRRDYHSRLDNVLNAMSANNPEAALVHLDALIARGEAGKKPEVKNLGLLYLERASINQSIQQFEAAANDLQVADNITEILDLTPQGAKKAAKYLFNDSAKVYHAPIYEKLQINMSAAYSYLAIGQRDKAVVAARRVITMAEYFENTEYQSHPMIGMAWFTAGLAMELDGKLNDANTLYKKALETFDSPLVHESLERLGEPRSEIISIVMSGLGPRKKPVRLPIGVVVGWVNDSSRFSFSDDEVELIGQFSAEELLTWVNFPVMKSATYAYEQFVLHTQNTEAIIPVQADTAAFAQQQWKENRPAVAWSAVTRALTRIAAREALQATGRAVEDKSKVGGGLLKLGGLIAQGTMQAIDTPDTRGWTLMPATIRITRTDTPPGPQVVTLEGHGAHGTITQTFDVNVPDNGSAIVVARIPY